MTPATEMQPEIVASLPVHFGFLTLPNFSMIAFTSAVEVLRMTNYVSRATHYRWSVVSADGVPVRASNGVTVTPTRTLEEVGIPDVLVVCGGTQIRSAVDTRVKTPAGRFGGARRPARRNLYRCLCTHERGFTRRLWLHGALGGYVVAAQRVSAREIPR